MGKEIIEKKENFVPDQVGMTPPMDDINQGTVVIEANRAIAEAQGKLAIAKRFPRDEIRAYAAARAACQRKSVAERAFYSYPRGTSVVTGASIRFAEELARCYGNIDYGIKELSRKKGESEMMAYAWDLETNTVSSQTFTNPHIRETKNSIVELKSDRDIYEINANMAARRLRARILAILPNYFVEDCIEECKKTIAGKNDEPLIDRVRKLVVQFEKIGVTKEMIERYLEKKTTEMDLNDIVEFVGIYNSIKDKQHTVSDWFEPSKVSSDLNKFLDDQIEKEK